jgi:hypothetical protein
VSEGGRIDLEAPVARAYQPVVRLIVGAIAERMDFAFEEIDDLQLAVERLLAESGAKERVRLSFETGNGGVRTRIGPLRERALAEALQAPADASELGLRRVLETLVDSFGVEEVRPDGEGEIVIRLEKLRSPR